MTNEKKLDIAISLLLSKDMDLFLSRCREYELAEKDYLACPYCESCIEHEIIECPSTVSWEIHRQYKCNDCGEEFIESFERIKIVKC